MITLKRVLKLNYYIVKYEVLLMELSLIVIKISPDNLLYRAWAEEGAN